MMTLRFYLSIFMLLITVSSCAPQTRPVVEETKAISPTLSPEPPIATVTPSPTPAPTVTADPVLRIRFKTTSDWTELGVDYFATWAWRDVVAASSEANQAEISNSRLVLNQPLERAEKEEAVEMTADLYLPDWEAGGVLIFRLIRGNLGYSSVQISRPVNGQWKAVKTFTWATTALDDKNSYAIEYSMNDLFTADPIQGEMLGDARSGFVSAMLQNDPGYSWWHDTVFYEISVRSFYDSNGDGIGDFNGLIEKLDYLNDGDPATTTDLGITGIWLRPINSCNSNHGYDVTDYYNVNQAFGTLEDFRRLIAEARARGIYVIIDLVVNHAGNQNPWFLEATDPSSPYHDWFIWSADDPGYVGSWGQKVWFPLNDVFYYSTFSTNIPDLNYKNPAVTSEMNKIVRFWLEDVGVDGFRFDAAKHLVEDGTVQSNTVATHDWYKEFRPFYKAIKPDAMIVGEIWEQADVQTDYLQGDEIDLAFDFFTAFSIVPAVNAGEAGKLYDQIMFSYTRQPVVGIAPILTNYDITRLMSSFKNNQGKAKVAASLNLTLPGVPFIYYGEEIGMQGVIEGMGYDEVRRPMQWSGDNNAGFSTADPWLAVGTGWEVYNVANETVSPNSILSHYRALIQARNQHSALRGGDLSLVVTENEGLYSILRVSQDEAVLVLVNLTGQPVTDYQLSLESSALVEGNYSPLPIMGEGTFVPTTVDAQGGFSGYVPVDWIPAYRTFILQLVRD